jgi:glycosyltransferase involved in cell wall biosynthesis
MPRRLLFLVTEDWYFLAHRLPMARAARAAGYEVHVATRLKDGKEAIEKEGFVPHSLGWSRGSLSPRGNFTAVLHIRRLLRELQPAILHNVSLKPVLLGGTASLGLPQLAVVNTITGRGTLFADQSRDGLTRKATGFALRLLLARARSRTTVENADDREFLIALGGPPEKIVVVPGSGVDTEKLKPLPEPPQPVTAAFAGRMLAIKGVAELIQAFSLLAERGIALQLLLAGDCDRENPGSLAPEQLCEFANLYGINWLGHVTDIREVWARAHFAVLASRGGEGVPMSLLEAAACGRPMVATDVPGSRDIVVDGVTGLTAPLGDVPALADAMATLAGDAAMRERFGKAARALVEDKFSAEKIGKEIVALYNELVSAQHASSG